MANTLSGEITPSNAAPLSAGYQPPPPDSPAPVAPNIGAPSGSISQDPTATAINSQPIDAPQQGKPSPWRAILMGALAGLAGSAGARGRQSFGTGLANGAASELNFNQQQKENSFRQQQLTQQKSFEDAQSAFHAASLAQQDKQLQLQTAEFKDKQETDAASLAKFMQDNFGIQYDVIPNTSEHASNFLKQAVANSPNGASVAPGGLVTDKYIYIPKAGENSVQQQFDFMQKVSPALGLPVPTQQQWNQQGPQGRAASYGRVQNILAGLDPNTHEYFKADQLPSVISNLQTSIDAYKKQPQHDEGLLNQMNSTVSRLQAQLKSTNDNAASAAAQKSAAEESAKLPFALREARAKQAISQGDPNAAGALLASGDLTLSELKSRGTTPDFVVQATNAAKHIDPTFNAQVAEAQLSAAKSPANVTFFGSAKSLTDKGGTLDQLQTNFAKLPNGQIPAFNKISDWVSAASGGGATAGFAQTALGAADDYAKVMGGGQGSDSARKELLDSFRAAHSPEAMAAAVQAARDAVNSQINSRIGKNRVMQRMYGTEQAATKQYDFSDPNKFPKAQ